MSDPTVKQQNAADLRRAERLANPDPEFAADVAAGNVESLDAWAARVALGLTDHDHARGSHA